VPKVSAEHKAEVRRRLLDAAGRVILRDGAEGVTTRAILDEAGLSAGTLYSYFSSKEDLLGVLAVEMVQRTESEIGEASGANAAQVLDHLVAEAVARPVPEPVLAYLRGRTASDGAVHDAIARFNGWLVDRYGPLIEAGQREGSIAPDLDAPAVIELLDVIFDGMNRRAASDTFATSFERVGNAARALVAATVLEPAP
jgi:AcrR family transcriptional regulator